LENVSGLLRGLHVTPNPLNPLELRGRTATLLPREFEEVYANFLVKKAFHYVYRFSGGEM
jgi:hypothetical protein